MPQILPVRSISQIILLLASLLSFLSRPIPATQSVKIKFKAAEGQRSGFFVGNIRTSLSSSSGSINTASIQIADFDKNYAQLFYINTTSGDVLVNAPIDREEVCNSRKILTSTNPKKPTGDGSKPSQSSAEDCQISYILTIGETFVDLSIVILDVNDCSPTFLETEYRLHLSESTLVGSKHNLPLATDKDSSQFNLQGYRILLKTAIPSPETFQKHFEVLNETIAGNLLPVLRVKFTLDWETEKLFECTLEAIDKGGLTGSTRIIIIITDINEHAPTWKNEPYEKTIKECTRENEIFSLLAEDADDDSTSNGMVQYHLREHLQDYNLIASLFYISGNILNVRTQNLLDLNQRTLEFYITASDGKGLSADTLARVNIEDCNNHKPLIEQKNKSVAVWENDRGVRLLTFIRVEDADRGINSDFHCSLMENKKFALVEGASNDMSSETSKWVIYRLETLNDSVFDRETEDKIFLVIQCTDRGTPPLSNQHTVHITVADKNDNPPHFSREPYLFSIPEGSRPLTRVGSLSCSDKDSGKNGLFDFAMDKPTMNQLFSINARGEILTQQSFDREKEPSYEFIVIAKDNGEPPLSSQTQVRIAVTDINDNSPAFGETYAFSIVESYGNAIVHQYIGRVTAVDIDLSENGTVYYRIGKIQTESIHPSSGTSNDLKGSELSITNEGGLSIYANVDRERMPSFIVEVIAYDRGRPSRSSATTVTIQVLDVNDNKPVFRYQPELQNSGYILNISTDLTIGSIAYQFEAHDPDLGENGSVTFEFIQPMNNILRDIFQLHEDGKLILKNTPPESLFDRGLHTLLVKATDNAPKGMTLHEYSTLKLRFISPTMAAKSSGSAPKQGASSSPSNKNVENWSEEVNIMYYYLIAAFAALLMVVLLSAILCFHMKTRQDRRGQYNSTAANDSENAKTNLYTYQGVRLGNKMMGGSATTMFSDGHNEFPPNYDAPQMLNPIHCRTQSGKILDNKSDANSQKENYMDSYTHLTLNSGLNMRTNSRMGTMYHAVAINKLHSSHMPRSSPIDVAAMEKHENNSYATYLALLPTDKSYSVNSPKNFGTRGPYPSSDEMSEGKSLASMGRPDLHDSKINNDTMDSMHPIMTTSHSYAHLLDNPNSLPNECRENLQSPPEKCPSVSDLLTSDIYTTQRSSLGTIVPGTASSNFGQSRYPQQPNNLSCNASTYITSSFV